MIGGGKIIRFNLFEIDFAQKESFTWGHWRHPNVTSVEAAC